MSKILMLDLEGVLIVDSHPEANRDYGVRPNAQYFVDESFKLFDKIFLNTCVDKEPALEIMRDVFGIENISYYNWDRSSVLGKASGYENFLGSKLIHIEDGSVENTEGKRIIELGFDYVSVPSWTYIDVFVDKKKDDVALLDALTRVKEIFAR